jgi:hypothetical protein
LDRLGDSGMPRDDGAAERKESFRSTSDREGGAAGGGCGGEPRVVLATGASVMLFKRAGMGIRGDCMEVAMSTTVGCRPVGCD